MKVKIKLDQLLDQRGITQRSLSRMTGIRHVSINEMCNNQTLRLTLDNLARICEVLECDLTDILELVPED